MWSVILIAMSAILGFAQTPRPMVAGGSYIGVMMQEVDSERAKVLKLHEAGGVEITVVEPDSPAEKAGLKVGDVVLKYNGLRVEGMQQFAHMVHETPPGREVKIDISRAGAPQSVTVKVAQRKAPHMEMGEMPPMPERLDIHIPDLPRGFMTLRSSVLGVEAESIDGQLAQYFGVKDGVLVRSVLKGTAAEKAGIRAGDVIVRIDDARVATPADISGRLRTLHGKAASVVLMRDHKELTISVTISDDDPGRIQITPMQLNPNVP
jgi:serine protease Do